MFSKTSSDEVPRAMLALLVELLASAQLPELAIGGAWYAMYLCLTGRPGLAKWAIEELGLFDLGMEHFRAIGSPADVVIISRGRAGRAHPVLFALCDLTRCKKTPFLRGSLFYTTIDRVINTDSGQT